MQLINKAVQIALKNSSSLQPQKFCLNAPLTDNICCAPGRCAECRAQLCAARTRADDAQRSLCTAARTSRQRQPNRTEKQRARAVGRRRSAPRVACLNGGRVDVRKQTAADTRWIQMLGAPLIFAQPIFALGEEAAFFLGILKTSITNYALRLALISTLPSAIGDLLRSFCRPMP